MTKYTRYDDKFALSEETAFLARTRKGNCNGCELNVRATNGDSEMSNGEVDCRRVKKRVLYIPAEVEFVMTNSKK